MEYKALFGSSENQRNLKMSSAAINLMTFAVKIRLDIPF